MLNNENEGEGTHRHEEKSRPKPILERAEKCGNDLFTGLNRINKTGMESIYFFYIFFTFAVGISAISLTAVAYNKTHNPLIHSYFTFHLAFSLAVFISLGLAYSSISRFPLTGNLIIALTYVEEFIIPLFITIALAGFGHCLFESPNVERKNGMVFGVAMIVYSLSHFFEFAMKNETFVNLRQSLNIMAMFCILLYTIAIGFKYVRTISDTSQKHLAVKILVMLILTVPIILYEESVRMPLPLHPLLYMALSLIGTQYSMKHAFHRIKKDSPAVPKKSPRKTGKTLLSFEPDADLFQQYNISPRERELIPLVLQGNTNQQIGETLYISMSTVKTHLRSIYSKFDVKNRYELIAFLQNMKQQ